MPARIKAFFFASEAGDVFRGMFTLIIGAGLARIIGLISMPILTRIYTAEDYAVLALYTSLVAVLTPIMTLRYVQAIPLPKSDTMAFNLLSMCIKLIIFFSFLIALLLTIWGDVILGWFNMKALIPWRWLIVLGVAAISLYEVFSLWATRKRQYEIAAKSLLFQSFLGNFVKVGLGMLAFKTSGMIVGQLLSQSAGITVFIVNWKNDFKTYLAKVKYCREKFIAAYYQSFVWFRLPSQFLMVLSIQAPILIMAALYDKESTGQLSLAMMALTLPVSLVGGAMSKAYYAEIAVLGRRNITKIIKLTFSIQRKLFLIGIPIALCIYFFSEVLFRLVFGNEWEVAGIFASMLAPFVFFQFTSSPLMEVVNVVGNQVVYLVLHGFRIIGLICIAVCLSYFKLDVNDFVIILSLYLSFFYLLASILVFTLLVRARGDH